MTTEKAATVHLWDAARPDDEDATFPVYVYTDVIPRIGDDVVYWIDYPSHLQNGDMFEEREPIRVSGKVKSVKIEYRVMRWGNPNTHSMYPMVSVYLDDYQAKLPPKQGV